MRAAIKTVVLRVDDDHDVRDDLVAPLALGVVDTVEAEARLLAAVRTVVAPPERGAESGPHLTAGRAKMSIGNLANTESRECRDIPAAAIAHDRTHVSQCTPTLSKRCVGTSNTHSSQRSRYQIQSLA